jgi:hypothetical protein
MKNTLLARLWLSLIWAYVVLPVWAQNFWDRRFGGTSFDEAYALVVALGGGYLVAGASSSNANGDKIRMYR